MAAKPASTPPPSPAAVEPMRLITVSELAMMAPQERYDLHVEREVKDLSTLPPEFLARIMARTRRIIDG